MSHFVIPDTTAQASPPARSGWRTLLQLTLIEPVLDLIFPAMCSGCGRVGAVLCSACQTAIQQSPVPVAIAPAPGLAALAALGPFEGQLRQAIHALKYDRQPALAAPLGGLLAQSLADTGWPRSLIVPVPLHAERLETRGFNQAALLAAEVARCLGWPCQEVLTRTRQTASQVGLGHTERQDNVRGAFSVTQPELIQQADIILIDDVYTTGATLHECALALQHSGAGCIRAIVAGRAGSGTQGERPVTL